MSKPMEKDETCTVPGCAEGGSAAPGREPAGGIRAGSAASQRECSFTLLEPATGADGDFYIARNCAEGTARVCGLFDAATGNVYACSAVGDDPRQTTPSAAPAVRIAGPLDGRTGQVTVRQPDGSYRRFSRWDRIDGGSPAQPDAIVRTLPQCGCGGSIGMPKLFDSFAEMSAYFFCTFAPEAQ